MDEIRISGLKIFADRMKKGGPAASDKKGRLAGRIAVVTGSAQGFGEGIAFKMVEEDGWS